MVQTALRSRLASAPWLWRSGVEVFVLLSLLLSLASPVARALAVASVDRSRIGENESITLGIRVDGTSGSQKPELGVLDKDFEVLGSSQSTNISILNGDRSAYTQWSISLMPRRSGNLRIPPIRVGGEKTEPIDIVVTRDPGAGASADRDVWIEIETDTLEVHVQQQLLLTVRLLHAVNLDRGASLTEPEIVGAVVKNLGENSYEKIVRGRRLGIYERRYAIFAQASGELVIPSLRFEASLGSSGSFFDPFGNRGRTIRLRSEEKHIRVLPPETGANPWLPSRMLTLVETWDHSPNELHVGESATRSVTIRAEGLTAAQIPPLPTLRIDGLRLYPDQPETNDEQGNEGITGARTERVAVIPERAGEIEFPEARVRWWDTVNRRFEEAVVPRKTIRVLPAAGDAAPPRPTGPASLATPETAPDAQAPAASPIPPSSAATTPWPWIAATLLLALTTLFSSWRWWRLARRSGMKAVIDARIEEDRIGEREAFRKLRDACLREDAAAVQQLLPAWARIAFPERGMRTIGDVLRFAGDGALRSQLQALLASRYADSANTENWDAKLLLGELESLRTRITGSAKARTDSPLPPLYA